MVPVKERLQALYSDRSSTGHTATPTIKRMPLTQNQETKPLLDKEERGPGKLLPSWQPPGDRGYSSKANK